MLALVFYSKVLKVVKRALRSVKLLQNLLLVVVGASLLDELA